MIYPALTELSQLVPHRTHGCLAKPGPDSRYVGEITDYCCLKPLTFGVINYPATDNCKMGLSYFIYASHYRCIFKLLLMSSFLLQSVLSPGWLQPLLLLFFFSIHLFSFIYLTVPGHSCGMWDLPSSLQHVGSNSPTRDQTEPPALGVWNLMRKVRECKVMDAGPPGKSLQPKGPSTGSDACTGTRSAHYRGW